MLHEEGGEAVRGRDAILRLAKYSPWPVLWMGYHVVNRVERVKGWAREAIYYGVRLCHVALCDVVRWVQREGVSARPLLSRVPYSLIRGETVVGTKGGSPAVVRRGVNGGVVRRRRRLVIGFLLAVLWVLRCCGLLLAMIAAMLWHLNHIPVASAGMNGLLVTLRDSEPLSELNEPFENLAIALGLNQKWNLYATVPEDFWLKLEGMIFFYLFLFIHFYHIIGVFVNGDLFELWGPDILSCAKKELEPTRPSSIAESFINHR